MTDLDYLVEILEHSVEKNGKDKPMTIGHFLNICKMAQRRMVEEDTINDIRDCYFDAND